MVNYIHRAVIETADGEHALSDWVTWFEARDTLISHGLATHVFGILIIHPAADIKMETY